MKNIFIRIAIAVLILFTAGLEKGFAQEDPVNQEMAEYIRKMDDQTKADSLLHIYAELLARYPVSKYGKYYYIYDQAGERIALAMIRENNPQGLIMVNAIKTDAERQLFLGTAAEELLKSGRPADAENLLKKALATEQPNSKGYDVYSYNYAELLYQLKRYDEALHWIQPVQDKGELSLKEQLTLYAKILVKTNHNTEAVKVLSSLVSNGLATEENKADLKENWLRENGNGDYQAYFNQLTQSLNQSTLDELKQYRVNTKAPQFALKDLNGKVFDLAQLKGKVVVLDYWATWCGACVAAFPAMQKAVNQYAENNNVVFLFINSREITNDSRLREAKVKKFMAARPFKFNVLLDVKDTATHQYDIIDKYKVEAIPAKFIIDQNGIIRYSIVGFNGGVDATVQEITAGIDGLLKDTSASAPLDAAYTLTAKINGASHPGKAYLDYSGNGRNIRDSAEIINGSFKFSGTSAGPVKARLMLDHTGKGPQTLGHNADAKTIYLNGDDMVLSPGDSIKNSTLTGSKLNDEYIGYNAVSAVPDQVMKVVTDNYYKANAVQQEDMAFRNLTVAQLNQQLEVKKNLQLEFCKQNPNSYFSLEALTDASSNGSDAGELSPLFHHLSPELQNSKEGKELAEIFAKAKGTSVGAIAPDFTQNDVNGKPVKLSDFKGKYVLLDFWASWCMSCRIENTKVVKAYNDFKNKNFTILGISLEQPGQKKAWLKAIAEDKLAWTQVSDLQFWKNAIVVQYKVGAIPQNFLIDPNGKIVAKNLSGDALEAKLKELFPKSINN